MARIFKVSAYMVDPMGEFNESSCEDCLVYCTQNDMSLRHIKVDSADIGEWDDDLPVNKFDCPITEFEKYFKEKTNA